MRIFLLTVVLFGVVFTATHFIFGKSTFVLVRSIESNEDDVVLCI